MFRGVAVVVALVAVTLYLSVGHESQYIFTPEEMKAIAGEAIAKGEGDIDKVNPEGSGRDGGGMGECVTMTSKLATRLSEAHVCRRGCPLVDSGGAGGGAGGGKAESSTPRVH
jgi:hypothetical protein